MILFLSSPYSRAGSIAGFDQVGRVRCFGRVTASEVVSVAANCAQGVHKYAPKQRSVWRSRGLGIPAAYVTSFCGSVVVNDRDLAASQRLKAPKKPSVPR